MIKNKSSSVSISNRSSTSATKNNNDGRKSSNKPRKPTIDRQIAKKLDTLDRQGLKYLKESLKASRIVDREKQYKHTKYSLQVEEDITIEDDIERSLQSPTRPSNEIEEEIPEVHEDEEPVDPPPQVIKDSRVRTTIKARPISAVQKESVTAEKNFSVDLYGEKQQQYQPEPFISPKGMVPPAMQKFPPRSSEPAISTNPFKKPPLRQKQVRMLSNNRQADGELQTLLHRIEKLEEGQRAQLEFILERMEKGEIEKVEMSSDVIVLGRSSSKPDISNAQIELPQNIQATKPVRSAMQKTRQRPNEIEQQIEEDPSINRKITETTSRQDSAATINLHQNKKEVVIPTSQSVPLTKPVTVISNRLAPLKVQNKDARQQLPKVEEPSSKKDKRKAASLTIRILDNWGHPSLVGLNHIEVFDSRGRRIAISQENIINPNKKLAKLFTGRVFTTDENQMWWGPLTRESGVELEVNCRQLIGAVRLWNYNKSLLEIDKGARLVEVEIKGDRVWRGEVARGCGNELEDYSTMVSINLEQGVEIHAPQVPQPPHKPTSKEPVSAPTSVIPKDQPASAFKKDNKPNWLESTLVANKLEDLRKEDLKYQAPSRQDSTSKRIKRTRESEDRRQEDSVASKTNLTKIDLNQQVVDRCSPDVQKNQISKSELAADRFLHLQKEAETVQRDVQNSLLSIKKNLNLEGDDIFTEMLANRKSTSLIDRQVVQQHQPEPSRFKREPSKGRKLIEEPIAAKQQDCSIDTSINKKPTSQQRDQRVLRVDNSKSVLIEDDAPVNRPICKPTKQPDKTLPTVGELNKASELDNLINELNDIIPKNQKIVVPELPAGQVLRINMLLTWGDPYFVGLAGIELFDQHGQLIEVGSKQISSKNSLPGSNAQTVDKLVNGVYLTTDNHNQWLSPFKKDSSITIDFGRKQVLSMVRLWNYNESRIHSTRGVRYLSMDLDSQTVFQGEVRKASGEQHNQQTLCEYILFTSDAQLIRKICEGDWLANMKKQENIEEQSLRDTMTLFRRPQTATQKKVDKQPLSQRSPVKRETTSLNINYEKRFIQEYETPVAPKGFTVRLVIRSTWGDRHFVGLNGIEILDIDGNNLLSGQNKFKFKVSPESVKVLPGYERDVRTSDKLLNGNNETFSDSDMWLAPFVTDLERLEKHIQNTIVFQFDKSITLGAINIYNYTKTPERGVRELQILLDQTLVFMVTSQTIQGYVRIGPTRDEPQPVFKTSIAFLREADFLRRIRYYNYNEDTLEQEVSMINESKQVSSGQKPQQYGGLERPPTSVTGRPPTNFL